MCKDNLQKEDNKDFQKKAKRKVIPYCFSQTILPQWIIVWFFYDMGKGEEAYLPMIGLAIIMWLIVNADTTHQIACDMESRNERFPTLRAILLNIVYNAATILAVIELTVIHRLENFIIMLIVSLIANIITYNKLHKIHTALKVEELQLDEEDLENFPPKDPDDLDDDEY